MNNEKLTELRVFDLAPRLKHSTIFKQFDSLDAGGSFIILNDHDPAPLYYEMKAERSNELDAFEYLEKGPELWRVRISKKELANHANESCCVVPVKKQDTTTTNEKSECQLPQNAACMIPAVDHNELKADPGPAGNACSVTVGDGKKTNEPGMLDVTKLAPGLKHPTIFQWFDALSAGESMTILNDHDPKPLYYQLIGERGSCFNWQYLEQGPQWWRVTISKLHPGEETIGEIAAKDIRKAEALKKLGIDFCCGGKKSVSQAANEAGVSLMEVESALTNAEKLAPSINPDFRRWDADFLADYIYNQHHKYYYENKNEWLALTDKVVNVHGSREPWLVKLKLLLEKLCNELDVHFYKEEKIIFPFIKELCDCKKNGTKPKQDLILGKGPLAMMEMEHDGAGEILRDLRTCTNGYTAPDGACNSFRLLYNRLQELESDLHTHIHLENNVLFPKAVEMEKGFLGDRV